MKVSASKVERLLECPASFHLPQQEEAPSAEAERGTAIHGYLERIIRFRRGGKRPLEEARTRALDDVPSEHRLACEQIDVQWLMDRLGLDVAHLEFMVEVGMWWNPRTGEAAFTGEHQSHPAREPENSADVCVTGIADLVVVNPKVGFAVFDYKSGRPVTKAQRNPQLLTLAHMASNALGDVCGPQVLGGIVYVWDGSSYFDHAEWDGFALIDHETAVLAALRLPPEDALREVHTGSWCKYCPAFAACPAQEALLREAGGGALERRTLAALVEGKPAEAVAALAALKTLTGKLQVQLQNYVDGHGPIAMPDGMEWGPRKSKRESLQGRVVYEVVKKACGQEVAEQAIEIDASKTKLREALRFVAKEKGSSLAQVERDMLALIRQVGGVEVKESITYDAHAVGRGSSEE